MSFYYIKVIKLFIMQYLYDLIGLELSGFYKNIQ